jgi:hypothetical protein
MIPAFEKIERSAILRGRCSVPQMQNRTNGRTTDRIIGNDHRFRLIVETCNCQTIATPRRPIPRTTVMISLPVNKAIESASHY